MFRAPSRPGLPVGIVSSVAVWPANADSLAEALGTRDIAAVILEPSGAAWGTVPLPGGFLAEVRRLADASGTLLIFDEVATGFRWAPGGVQAVSGVRPDLTVLGKILAGGMPGGAACGRADLMEQLSSSGPARVSHPGTHNAHPVCAAAGLTTLGLVSSGEAKDRAARTAATLRDELTAVFARSGVAGRAYGESSTFHLLFGHHEDPADLSLGTLKAGLAPQLTAALHCGMLSEGVQLFHGSGFVSTAHTERDVEQTVRAFAATVACLQADGLV